MAPAAPRDAAVPEPAPMAPDERIDPWTVGMPRWSTQTDVQRELQRRAAAAAEAAEAEAEARVADAAPEPTELGAAGHAVGHVPPAMPAPRDPHQPTAKFPHGWHGGFIRAPDMMGAPSAVLRGGGDEGEWLGGRQGNILRRPLLSWRGGPGGYGYRLYIGGLEPNLTTDVLKDWVAAAGGESDTFPKIEYPGEEVNAYIIKQYTHKTNT